MTQIEWYGPSYNPMLIETLREGSILWQYRRMRIYFNGEMIHIFASTYTAVSLDLGNNAWWWKRRCSCDLLKMTQALRKHIHPTNNLYKQQPKDNFSQLQWLSLVSVNCGVWSCCTYDVEIDYLMISEITSMLHPLQHAPDRMET